MFFLKNGTRGLPLLVAFADRHFKSLGNAAWFVCLRSSSRLCTALLFSDQVFSFVFFIGEFFDLEKLSQTCAETGRYTFFFSSWPLNM